VKGRPGEAYNIGQASPEITMKELADRMAAIGRELFGFTGSVVVKPSADEQYLTDNPQRRCPDISKARRELAFSPSVGPDEGFRRTLIWYAANADGEDA
jgi:nucleoside-diphosphate-sugar epimerase